MPDRPKSLKSLEAKPLGLKPEDGVKQEDVTKEECEAAREADEAAAKEVSTEAVSVGGVEVSELLGCCCCCCCEASAEVPAEELLVPEEPFCKDGGAGIPP